MAKYHNRKVALEAGVTKFWTGEPCRNGHIAYRWTLNGSCCECQNKRRKAQSEKYRAAKQAKPE